MPDTQEALEHGTPEGKRDGRSTRIFLSLKTQRKPRLDDQEAKGTHPIKVVISCPVSRTNYFLALPPFD